jgi:hypothetical protein
MSSAEPGGRLCRNILPGQLGEAAAAFGEGES